MTTNERIDRIRTVLRDPNSVWCGSDLVWLVGDLCDDIIIAQQRVDHRLEAVTADLEYATPNEPMRQHWDGEKTSLKWIAAVLREPRDA